MNLLSAVGLSAFHLCQPLKFIRIYQITRIQFNNLVLMYIDVCQNANTAFPISDHCGEFLRRKLQVQVLLTTSSISENLVAQQNLLN